MPTTSWQIYQTLFISSVASIDQHPDLVVWSDTQQIVILVELTVHFETNFIDATQRKRNKYQDPCIANGYATHLVTLEVGSRGLINISGFKQPLGHFAVPKEQVLNLLRAVSRETILQTHKIWTAHNKVT